MKQTANYRHGFERFIPSPSEAVLLAAMVIFCWKMYGGTSNDAIAGLNSVVVVTIAWVLGVALRATMNDMRWWLVIGFLMLLIVPWLGANTFQISLMAQVCAYTLLLLGLNIVTGLTGQISLGHGALVGISAYTVAILVHQYDWNFLAASGVAIAITTAAGFALGIPALRLTGPYLAIATLAAALIFPGVLKLDQVNETTGGVQGIAEAKVSPPGAVGSFLEDHAPGNVYKNAFQKKKFAQEAYIFYLSAAAALISLFCAWNLARSRFGRAFIAVRDGEVAATSMGVNVALYKVTAFGISALYAGVCGVLFFLVISFVAPESFDLVNLSINPLAFMVIGGLATTGGPVIGAIGFMWVPQIIKKIATISSDFDKLQGAMTGLLLIVVMTRMPQGVWGMLVRINRLSWPALIHQSQSWAGSRSTWFWAGLAAGIVAILVIGQLAGAVWAVFAAALFVVAPQDVWYGVYEFFRRPVLALRGGGNESTQRDAT